MAKAKTATAQVEAAPAQTAPVNEKKATRSVVKEIVQNIGADANFQSVSDALHIQGYTVANEGSLRSNISTARSELGFAGTRASKGKPVQQQSAEPTLAQYRTAQKLCASLKLKPQQLQGLVNQLKEFGDLDILDKCVAEMLND